MDPNYLEELKKLKEQKDADLEKLQDLARMSIPDLEDTDTAEESATAEPSGGTIKFEPVNPDITPSPAGPRSRRARQPSPEEIARQKKKKKQKKIFLISLASTVAAFAILLTVFFAVSTANKANFTYEYWGMGLNIENGVTEYDFFGNLETMTRFDEIGQPQLVAEFEDGKCIKETKYNAEGDTEYYYTHEYDDNGRILSAYFEDGQMVISEKYTIQGPQKIKADRTYHKEENRTESAVLTLENGNITLREVYENGVMLSRDTYDGTMITHHEEFDETGILSSRTVYEFNRAKKLLLTEVVYDANNTTISRTVNEYDEKSDLLKKVIRYDGLGEIVDYDTYNYDLNENPIKQVRYAKDGTIQKQILKVFNDKNRVIKETCLMADGSIVYCYGYDYDTNGYVSTSIVYNTEMSTIIDRYTLFTRTASGSITQSDTYNASNVLVEKIIYNTAGFATDHSKYNDAGVLLLQEKTKYDDKQRILQKETSTYSDDAQLLTFISEQFDDQGRVTILIREDTEAELYEQILCRYSAEGNLEQQTVFDKDGKTVRDETLDAEGRVVKETLYENGVETEYNEYLYNAEGLVSQKKHLDHLTGDLINIAYSYNAEKVLETAVETDSNNQPLCKKEYDENGLISRQINYDPEEGMIADIMTFQYDSEGRVIQKETTGSGGEMISKVIYYYRPDGSFDYTEYGSDGQIIVDTRDESEIEEEIPDAPPEFTDPEPPEEDSDVSDTGSTPSDGGTTDSGEGTGSDTSSDAE